MRLTIENFGLLKDAGFKVSEYDIPALRARTSASPRWLHMGAGNIFRAFPAAALDTLISKGLWDTGVIVCEGYDGEIIDQAYASVDNLAALCTLRADGTVSARVIASVTESLRCDGASPKDDARLRDIARQSTLQMISMTITEKGYAARGAEDGPDAPRTAMAKLCALMLDRYRAGGAPIALVSLDNCSHNGDKLRGAILSIASDWQSRGLTDAGFTAYLTSPMVSYPLTMIDKITPRPDPRVAKWLGERGFEDTQITETSKHSFVAPFVNAEPCEYLVVQDVFPAGRPPLELAGIYMTGRDTVEKAERMKVCACLNPLHTALGTLGCLLNLPTIYDCARDPALRALIECMAFDEAIPTADHPGILSPETFAREVIQERFLNPFMPDTPQRIVCDNSQKIPVRYGETLKAYAASDKLELGSLRGIPFAIAAYLRYLRGTDDAFEPMKLSPDPLLPELCELAKTEEGMLKILSRTELFGIDLNACGMADGIMDTARAMLAAPGAVRRTLDAFAETLK